MPKLVYDVGTFKGLNLVGGTTNGQVVQCDNFDAASDTKATTLYHGFLTKFPKETAAGSAVSTNNSLGIFMFVPASYAYTGTPYYLQGLSDGTMRYLNSSTWTTLNSGFTTTCPFDFAPFLAKDRVFICNGIDAIKKWATAWAAGNSLRDKSATATALTGTLTFTVDSTAVSGSGTAFSTELQAGDWIRKSSTDDWYEVNSVTSDTALVLVTDYLGTTGAGTVGTSQKASTTTIRARYALVWKDRLFFASGDTTKVPIVGTAVCDDASTPLP